MVNNSQPLHKALIEKSHEGKTIALLQRESIP